MRFFEFDKVDNSGGDRLLMVLRNYIGRASSKKAPSKLNWGGLNTVLKASGFELGADYETFKAMYDGSPALQNIVHDFNADGVTLKVPGVSEKEPQQDGKSSADKIDKMASSAAAKQVAQNQKTPKV
jgi:hypothetical protein